MTTMHKTISAQASLRRTPTTGTGEFTAVIATWVIDHDFERFDRRAFDDQVEKRIDVRYQHNLEDPQGVIGWAIIRPTDEGLVARGRLNLADKMATAVYERMLRGPSDPRALREFSISFAYIDADTTRGPQGERVFLKAEVLEVSVVYAGAQIGTHLRSLKSATRAAEDREAEDRAWVVKVLAARGISEEEARAEWQKHAPAARRSSSVRTEELKTLLRALLVDDLRPPIAEDVVRRERALLDARREEERRAQVRMERARRRLSEYQAAMVGVRPQGVVIDQRMRPVWIEGETERERDAKERAQIEFEAAEKARREEAEAAPRPETASLMVLPGKRRES